MSQLEVLQELANQVTLRLDHTAALRSHAVKGNDDPVDDRPSLFLLQLSHQLLELFMHQGCHVIGVFLQRNDEKLDREFEIQL